MNRVALIVLFLIAGLTACKKASIGGIETYRAQAIIDDKIIADYLKANPSLVATKVDTSGVYAIIEDPGNGNDLYTRSTQVTIGYTGRLLKAGVVTGPVFAQTGSKTTDFHPTYTLSQVILGWQIGIPLVKKGGIIRLLVPSRYGYGAPVQPLVGADYELKNGLPANAILDFEIQVFDIIN